MKFFSGTRDKKPGKLSASDRYKQTMNKKSGGVPDAKEDPYKKMMEAKMAKMTENALLGIKPGGNFQLPGTKTSGDAQPKEMSKNALKMMQMLAMQKAQKDSKIEKKRVSQWKREQKSIRNAKTAADLAAEEAIAQAKKEAEAAYQQAQEAGTNFFGHPTDDKGGW